MTRMHERTIFNLPELHRSFQLFVGRFVWVKRKDVSDIKDQ